MTTRDSVSSPTQILRQVFFHLDCRLKGHWVQVSKKFREQLDAIALHDPGIFDAGFVIREAFLRREAGQADGQIWTNFFAKITAGTSEFLIFFGCNPPVFPYDEYLISTNAEIVWPSRYIQKVPSGESGICIFMLPHPP